MDLNPVILAIPVYFTLMGAELIYEAFSGRQTYRLNDAVTNINLGALDQLTGTFTYVVKVGIYTLVYEHARLVTLDPTWLTFAALFVLWDLCYYWSHRMAHEISLFWGGHVVHHQSEDFNLSTALRQSSTAFIWSMPFYLPLAVLGFSPVQFLFVGGINLLYQFWIHTEHIGRLGPLERVMNTPSHHRVHHGRDPKYIDRNYAGVFIVWDRLFGTFQEEEERPHYGITRPLESWNPVYANVAHYLDLFREVRCARSMRDAARMLFGRPGWRPDYLGGYDAPRPVPEEYAKYDAHPASSAMTVYVGVQFFMAMGIVAFYLFGFSTFPMVVKVALAAWIMTTTVAFGVFFESQRRGIWLLEVLRLVSIAAAAWWLQGGGWLAAPFGTGVSAAAAASLIWFLAVIARRS
ncbi:MAG: sterol desaturase [Bacteroidetes bacterium CG12_big_fil_rev_8_21_14_0_65_60_17]|nr:MAG: sterol desaturase [Bacteroidetes bacterium CG12_big_fil_rev_8_21_14_0_65_60_17]